MTWQDYTLARKFLLETRIGTRVREAKQAENKQAASTAEHLSRQERRGTRRNR